MKKNILHKIAVTSLLFVFSIDGFAQTPTHLNSILRNTNIRRIEMTYSVNLANITPPSSAFNVMVNSISRPITAVAVTGTKVMLYLPTVIYYGEVITVSYTIPAENQLQSVSGELAANLSAQTVINNSPGGIVPIQDGDHNTYTDIGIGFQVWLGENLKTKTYNDGTIIPNITGATAWAGLTSPAYCWHDNEEVSYKDTYGALYNWYTVDAISNGNKNVCPAGYHVPNIEEWMTLSDFLGGYSTAGGKLKEIGTTHWADPNIGATNETNFAALPGGYRGYAGSFELLTTNSYWWSSTTRPAYTPPSAWAGLISNSSSNLVTNFDYPKTFGMSVRCLQNVQPLASVNGTTTVCQGAIQPEITFTGIAGTAPFTFTYSINGGTNQTIATITGNSISIPVNTINAGTFTFSLLRVEDAYNNVAQTGSATITVTPANTITLTSAGSTTSQTVCTNTTITNINYATTGATGADFIGLPAGVSGSFAGNNISISGTPTVSGPFNYIVTLTGGCGPITSTGTITVNPDAAIVVTSAEGTNAQSLCINTSITNITYSVSGGGTGAGVTGLPAGVTGVFNAGVLNISGTPTVIGSFNYTVTTTGTCVQATAAGTITVNPDAAIALTPGTDNNVQSLCINTPITNITYVTTGATGATFSGLPAGVSGSFVGSNISISGTPTVSGPFNYTVTLTGGCGAITSSGTIMVNPDAAIVVTSAEGTNAQSLCINTAITNITYSVSGGGTGAGVTGLPTGVNGVYDSGVFTITGTPTVSGTFNYTVTTTGTCAQTTATGTIAITPDNTILLTSANNNQTVCINTAIANINYTTTGATGATFTGMPSGLTVQWAANVATISGIPTASGSFNYTVTLTGGCGIITANGTITVYPSPVLSFSSITGVTCNKCQDGAINITATGGTGSLTYTWTGPYGFNSTTEDIVHLKPGSFNLVVTDINTCTVSNTYEVPNPFVVTNTSDIGDGSLRNAISYANGTHTVMPDTISFNIGSVPFTIQPSTPLPTITDPVIINGYSQPGASASNSILLIELDGTNTDNTGHRASGLYITSGNCTIKGLVINRFPEAGINIYNTSIGNRIEGNYIGTNINGTTELGNSAGISVGIAANENKIGGTTLGERNIISGNQVGIVLTESFRNIIKGNYIGVDVSGKLPLGNKTSGVLIQDCGGNIIGGANPNERNIISSNEGDGIIGTYVASRNTIKGNYIGTDVSGKLPLGNAGAGIRFESNGNENVIGGAIPGEGNVISDNKVAGIAIKSNTNKILGNYLGTDNSGTDQIGNLVGIIVEGGASGNQIGDTINGGGNIIAFSKEQGIVVTDNTTIHNVILGNSIHSNTGLGIDLGNDGVTANDNDNNNNTGANNLQNFPALTSVSFSPGNVKITGSLNSKSGETYTLQFFTNNIGDESGYGEGQTYLGSKTVTTDGSGNAAFSESFSIYGRNGQTITATATDALGNTSEFSNAAGGLADQELPGGTLHYVYNETGALKITDGTDITAITNSFQTWSDISTANITFINDLSTTVKYANASDGINLVSFVDDQYGWTPGVLAYSAKLIDMSANSGKGQILDADIIVNPEFANVLKGTVSDGDVIPDGYYDIQSIITHEIGHNLGLLHSGVVNSTMFYWLKSGTTDERTLEPDDEACASYKYPGGSYSSSYGTISGDITYGYSPNPKVIGALVTAKNIGTGKMFHSYSENDGEYVVPVPAGLNTQYYVDIQPLDGSVNGFNITPSNISNYIFSNAVYFDYPNEFYNSAETSTEDVNLKTGVPVSAGSETTGINIITNIDIISPTVVSITPENGAEVEILPDIIIKFSEPVDITTFSNASCYLLSGANMYFGSYTKLGGNSDAIIFTPKDPLPYSTTFALHLIGEISQGVKGITDLKGNPLDITGLPAYSVTTINSDNVPPTILSTVPANNASGVFVTDKISVSFSEPMNKTSVQDNFAVTSSGSLLTGSFSWNNELTTVTFTPSRSLLENTIYTLTLSDKLTDLHGIRMGQNNANVTYNFTTVTDARPKITYRGPADKKTGVTVSTPIVVDFTEPINTSTVDQTSFMLLLNGTQINGSFEFLNDNSRVVFRPDADLQFGKTYTVTLTESIMDVSVNIKNLDLEGKATTTFTTATQPVAPSIYYIDSPSGAHSDEVTIAGEGFDPNPVNNKVNFASVSATVTGATLDNLTVKVPTEATSGLVNVSVKNVTTASGYYFYVIPDVLDLPENWATSSADSKSNPKGVALKTDGATAYITNPGLNTVSIIDMATLQVTGFFNVGIMPLKIDLNPLCTKAYVTNYGSNTISVIDLITNSVKEIKVGLNPYGIAVTPTGDRVYVANYSSNNVSVIDINPNSGGFDHVVANVNTGTGNKDLKVTGDAGLALVAGDDGLKIVDINKKDANYNCVVATANSGTKTKEVNPNGDATLAVVITEEGTLFLVDISPQSDFFGTAVASGASGSNNKGGKPSGEGLHIFVTTENNDVLVYEIGTGGAPSSGGSYAGKITLKQVATIDNAGNGDLIFDTRNEKLVAVYSGTGNNDGGLKVTSLLKGSATPESGIAGLIIAVRQLMTDGAIKAANGKELINKLYDALNDLQNKKTKNVINDLNAFINKVKAQVPKNKSQAIIDAAYAIIKQLQGTKSEDEELNLNDPANQPNQEIVTQTKLGVIYPNPTKEGVTINYEVADNEQGSEKVTIQIYDVIGRLVSNLVNKNMAPGRYTATWNGSFDKGEMASRGFYFIRFSAGNTNEVKQILLVR